MMESQIFFNHFHIFIFSQTGKPLSNNLPNAPSAMFLLIPFIHDFFSLLCFFRFLPGIRIKIKFFYFNIWFWKHHHCILYLHFKQSSYRGISLCKKLFLMRTFHEDETTNKMFSIWATLLISLASCISDAVVKIKSSLFFF